jgi:DNA repair exonuclease SbcCD ATPase subunit
MNFMSYTSKVFDLPSVGLIYITGPNGSGKSSILEAVSVCLWGRSLRGASPWVDGQKGRVVCELEVNDKKLVVRRERDANDKKSLSFSVDGVDYDFPTATKAQEALCTHVGQWDLWRKTSVLSSQDAAHFSSATDSEKKRLLESLIGLEKYERAQKIAKEQTNGLQEELNKAKFVLQEKQTNVAVLSASLERLIETRGTLESLEANQEANRQKTLTRIAEAEAKIAAAQTKIAEYVYDIADTDKELASVAKALELHAMANATECYACGTKLKQKPDERHRELTMQMANLQNKLMYLRGNKSQLSGVLQTYLFSKSSAESDLASIDSTLADSLAKNRADVEKAEVALTEAQLAMVSAKANAEKANVELEVNKHVCELLSIRRIRSRLLLDAIGLATPLIQQRLAQLTDSITVEISPTSELANGTTKDAISLKITGAGGTDGYSGCSGGQRRRIDVGILLGLADLACAYTGKDRDSLYLDEIFDALDGQGIEKVQELIQDIATTEQVFLISHTQMALQAALHIVTG